MASIIAWVSVVFCTPIALLMVCMAGAMKVLPFHPKNEAMTYGFSYVYGPFIGCPGTPLRLMVGLGEFIGGLCLLIGTWGDVLELFGDGGDLIKALVIADLVGLFIITSVAALMHSYVDGAPGPPMYVAIFSCIVLLLRMVWVGPDHTANQITATVLSMVIMIVVIVTLIINKTSGLNEKQVEDENKKYQEMMSA